MTRQNKRELVEEICELAGCDDTDYRGNGHMKRHQMEAVRDALKEAYGSGN